MTPQYKYHLAIDRVIILAATNRQLHKHRLGRLDLEDDVLAIITGDVMMNSIRGFQVHPSC